MTPTARTSISAFPRSHEFAPSTFVVTPADVAAYLAAIGDAGDYGDAVPPLAAVALGLAALQEQIALPEGSLHTGQEVDHEATLHVVFSGSVERLDGLIKKADKAIAMKKANLLPVEVPRE